MAAQLDVYKEWLGIPEGPRPPDHYDLLRLIRFEDNADKIRTYYRKLNGHVRKYATGQYLERSQELLNELAKAMLCLTDPQRKRDYDQSLGREFEEVRDELGRKPVEEVLVDKGLINREQMRELLEFADKRGLSTRDAAVQMKLVEPDVAAQALATHLGMTYVDLEDMLPEDSVLDIVPRQTVKKHSCLPLFIDDGTLLVACVDEPDHELEEDLRLRFGIPMRGVLATPRSINQAIAKYYAPGARDESKLASPTPSSGKTAAKAAAKDKPKAAAAAGASSAGKPFSALSPGEKQHRKQMGWIMMCWGLILPFLFDTQIIWNFFLSDTKWPRYMPMTTWLVAPAMIFYVLKIYWK